MTLLRATAAIVPMGMLRRGFFSSPDMLAPAMMPVAAGKKTANTTQKEVPLNPFSGEPGKLPMRVGWYCIAPVKTVANIEISASTRMPMMTNWMRKASPALTMAMPKRTAKVSRSTTSGMWLGKMLIQPSRKPKMYIATASVCDR